MKAANGFLISMYTYLFCSFAAMLGLFWVNGTRIWGNILDFLLILYLFSAVLVQIAGIVSVVAAGIACQEGKCEQLQKGWKTLKLYSIPFYVFNFIFSLLLYIALVTAAGGLFILLPIPILFTCGLIAESGVWGIFYVKSLRRYWEEGVKLPSRIHFLFQMLPALDVISTLILLNKNSSPKPYIPSET